MKKVFTAAFSAILIAGTIISCSDNFSTKSVEHHEKTALAENHADSLTIEIAAEYPISGITEEAISNMSGIISSNLFGKHTSEMTPEDALKDYVTNLVNDYKETNLPLINGTAEGYRPILNWEEYITGTISGHYNGILSYMTSRYSYTGGAHGMSTETFLNFDMQTGRLIREQDLFYGNYEDTLTTLLTKHLPEAFEDPQYMSMLFQQEISSNGNFSVSENGITYTFNQYEVGPYALGIIRVTIPWNELNDIIKK